MIWETPIDIRNTRIKNRIVFPPISQNWATLDGHITTKILNFYYDIASGGCGMIVVSGTAVSKDAKGSDRSLCLYGKQHIPGLMKLSAIIKQPYNCFAVIQLMHVGGQGNPVFTKATPVSPSGLTCRSTGIQSSQLTFKEIDKIINQFIYSALLAEQIGFDAVELHLAHGYLLHEFLSHHTNKRQDQYGGSIENCARMVINIIQGIKARAPGLIIGARISGDDYLDKGITCNINKRLLPMLENAGIDYFSVTAGIYETAALKHYAMAQGKFFTYARQIKSIVSKPVIGVGKILDLKSAEKNLTNHSCDMVAIGRGLVADPLLIIKEQKGNTYNRCIECGQCQYLRFNKSEMTCPLWEKGYD